MTLTDYLLIGLTLLVITIGILLYYHHISTMDMFRTLSVQINKIVNRRPPPDYNHDHGINYDSPAGLYKMQMAQNIPRDTTYKPNGTILEEPIQLEQTSIATSTESELERQIEQYKRELEGIEDDLVFNNEDRETQNDETNDSDGSSVLKAEEEIDTVELENAKSELGETVSQSNDDLKETQDHSKSVPEEMDSSGKELKEIFNSEQSETKEEKVIEHIDDLENPSSQKDELMENIINQEVRLESIGVEEESQITNIDAEQEIGILMKKFSNEQLKEYCKVHGLLIKGGKKEMSKRLLGCKEFREELMLKGEL